MCITVHACVCVCCTDKFQPIEPVVGEMFAAHERGEFIFDQKLMLHATFFFFYKLLNILV